MNTVDLIELFEATDVDLETMLEIYNYYITNTTALFDYTEINFDEFKNRIYIKDNRYKTFIVHVDNEMVGFCFLTHFRKRIAYEQTVEIGLYLKQQFTGKGLGRKMVKYMESVAKSNNFKTIIASISGENVQSINLFKKLNYEQCAHYKGIAVKFGRKLDIIDFQKAI